MYMESIEQNNSEENSLTFEDFINNVALSANNFVDEIQKEMLEQTLDQQIKEFYLGKNYKPVSIEKVEVPEHVTPSFLIQQLSKISKKIQEKTETLYKNLSSKQPLIEYGGVYVDENGNLDEINYKKHLEYDEFVKNISEEQLNGISPQKATLAINYKFYETLKHFVE